MLLINELRYSVRQPLTLLSFIFLPLFSYLLSVGLQIDEGNLIGQFQLSQMSLIMLTLPIVIAIFSVQLMQRDINVDMTELINSTPISNHQRKLLRFGAVTGLVLLIFIVSFIISIIAYSLSFSFKSEFILYTMTNIVLLLTPTILLGVASALLLSNYFQSNIVIFVSFSVLWLGYLFIASITGSPILAGSSIINESIYQLVLYSDPNGITAVVDQLKNPEWFLNAQFLLNRFTYLVIAVAILYIALKVKPRDKKAISTSTTKKVALTRELSSPFANLIKIQFITLLKSRLTQLILLLWMILIFNEILSGISFVEPLSIVSPSSIDALNRIAFDLLPVIGCLLLVLWSWQICQQDKRCHIAELTAAIAISNNKRVLSELFTIGLMVIILLLLTAISSIAAEWVAGSNWSPSHYFIQLSLNALPLFLIGSIFVAIHHCFSSPLKVAGVIVLILLAKFTPITSTLGITHTLWNIADSPLQQPDHFWGYEGSLSLYLPYLTIGTLISIQLILLAIYRSHRGTGFECIPVEQLPKKLFLPLLITIVSSVMFHLSLISEKPLYNSDKREAWKAKYEQTFSHWQSKPQPNITHIDAQIDVYPDEQYANFKLKYTFENQTNQVIPQILIGGYGNQNRAYINLDNADELYFNSELNQSVYQFKKALLPGEKRQLQASFTFEQPQLWPARMHKIVKPSFTYLRSVGLLPTIGYQQNFQLTDSQIRKRYGLNPLNNPKPSINFAGKNINREKYNWLSLNSVISTKEGHYAISQGELIDHWQEDNREYYHYQTSSPIRAIPAWLSLSPPKLTRHEQGIELNVFSKHINHSTKINMQAMTDTISWLSEHVSPYRAKQLHLIATPDLGASGYALPQIILINDKLGFRAKPEENSGFDQRYRRAVHETAHQWFGHDLGNGITLDRSFLIESMAKYIELVLIEKHAGKEAMQALVDYEFRRFTRAERTNLQKPISLIDATLTHHMYSRATLAFAQLRKSVSDKIITQSLKVLWLQHAYPKQPATSMDFINILKQHTNEKHHPLIQKLFLSDKPEF
jgi:hypothetical protein